MIFMKILKKIKKTIKKRIKRLNKLSPLSVFVFWLSHPSNNRPRAINIAYFKIDFPICFRIQIVC